MINQYLDGKGTLKRGMYAMPNSNLYTMIPDENTVKATKEKIREIENATVPVKRNYIYNMIIKK